MYKASLFGNGELLQIGKAAERMAESWFASQCLHWIDVSNHANYQRREIDFLATDYRTGHERTYEVKSDQHIHRSGNFLFEPVRIHHTAARNCAYLGWSVFTEADYILVWSPPAQCLYVVEASAARQGFQRYTAARRASTRITWITSDAARSTLNVLIPLRYIPHEIHIYHAGRWQKGTP